MNLLYKSSPTSKQQFAIDGPITAIISFGFTLKLSPILFIVLQIIL